MGLTTLLTAAQQAAFDKLLPAISACPLTVLKTKPGMGRTTILKALHAAAGGVYLDVRQLIGLLAKRHPLAIEEAFLQWVDDALAKSELAIVDDLHLIANVADCYDYPRRGLLEAVLTTLADETASQGKRLLFGLDGESSLEPLARRAGAASSRTSPPKITRSCAAPASQRRQPQNWTSTPFTGSRGSSMPGNLEMRAPRCHRLPASTRKRLLNTSERRTS